MLSDTNVVIDLDALKHNAAVVGRCAPNSRIMAVIKADAYGHGMVMVAKTLSNVDGYAVAQLNEALTLRKAGIKKTILVLTGFGCSDDISVFSKNNLDAVVHSDYQLDLLACVSPQQPLSVWLKINTGMNRLGVEPLCVTRINNALALSADVRQPIKLMTHLACADDMTSTATQEQIAVFDESIDGMAGEQSICNSAGLLGWKYAQRDWVRPGLMLYGASPFFDRKASDDDLKPVMTFNSRVIALRSVKKSEKVGYGGCWVAEKTSLIATVGAGYGDGYPRHAVTGTPVLIGGQRVPLVGRVSMDSINVDASQCKNIKVGDTVTLWGEGLPIDEVAQMSETISYELMCGITGRVSRVVKGAINGE